MNFFRISRQIPDKSDAFCFFNQICGNKLESCRNVWNLWELFTIFQNYSLVSLAATMLWRSLVAARLALFISRYQEDPEHLFAIFMGKRLFFCTVGFEYFFMDVAKASFLQVCLIFSGNSAFGSISNCVRCWFVQPSYFKKAFVQLRTKTVPFAVPNRNFGNFDFGNQLPKF